MLRQLFILIVAVMAINFNLNPASAQLAPGEFRQLRSDDPACAEGFTCFQVGPYESGAEIGFDRMLRVVNHGVEEAQQVTILQLEAANPCGVMYTSPGRRSAVNGECSRNGTSERVTFAEYCDGASACSRWPFAGRVYRVPSVRILTPDERAEEMAREIANAVVTETVPAPSTLGANLRELIELRSSDQPPTDAHEVAALTAMADALDRTSATAHVETAPDMVFDHAETAARSEESDALADANARVAELETELAALRATPATGGWSTGLGIALGIAVLIILMLLFTRRPGVEGSTIINLTDDERREIEAKAEAKYKKKFETTNTQLKEIADTDVNLKMLRALQKTFLERMGEVMNDRSFEETLSDARAYRDDWKRLVKGYTPKGLADALANAKVFERMEKAFAAVFGELSPPIAFGEYAFAGLQHRHEKALADLKTKHDADLEALDESFQNDLRAKGDEIATRDTRILELTQEKSELQEQLNDSLTAAAQVVAEELDVLLFNAPWYREDLRGLTARHELTGERNIDYSTVVRLFGIPAMLDGKRWKQSDRLASRQKTLDLYNMWLKIYEGLHKLTSRFDALAGRKAASDLTPPPGSIPAERPLTMPPPPAELRDLGDDQDEDVTGVAGTPYRSEPESVESESDLGREPTVITSIASLAGNGRDDATTKVANLGPDGEPVRTGKTLMGLPAAPIAEPAGPAEGE